MMHWASQYIGEAWISGSHDCWAFVRRVYAEQYGIALPVVAFDATSLRDSIKALANDDERTAWRPVDSPVEGDAVLMAKGTHPSHVGVWLDIDGGGVLHCVDPAGVLFQGVQALRLSGWQRLTFYRRAA